MTGVPMDMAKINLDQKGMPIESAIIDLDDVISPDYRGRDVELSDIIKATNNEMMADAGALTMVRAIGTAAPVVAGPLGSVIAGAAYIGTDIYYGMKNYLKSDDPNEFWTDYYRNVHEAVEQNNALAGFVDGSSFMTGHALDERLRAKTKTGAFIGGNMAGILFRDMAAMMSGGALFKGSTQAVQSAASTNAFIAGPSIANGLNSFATKVGNTGDIMGGIKVGLAHGAATGVTGMFYMKYLDKILKNVSAKLVDTAVGSPMKFISEKGIGSSMRFGGELGGWAYSEDFLTVSARKMMGDKEAKMHMTPQMAAGMFALGSVGAFAAKGLAGMMSRVHRSLSGDRIIQTAIKESTEEVAKEGAKEMAKEQAKDAVETVFKDAVSVKTTPKTPLELMHIDSIYPKGSKLLQESRDIGVGKKTLGLKTTWDHMDKVAKARYAGNTMSTDLKNMTITSLVALKEADPFTPMEKIIADKLKGSNVSAKDLDDIIAEVYTRLSGTDTLSSKGLKKILSSVKGEVK